MFKKTGHRTYQLKHPAWNWDASGNLTGTLIIRETITLDAGGTIYHGSFTFDFYDLSGDLITEVAGTVTAQPITTEWYAVGRARRQIPPCSFDQSPRGRPLCLQIG